MIRVIASVGVMLAAGAAVIWFFGDREGCTAYTPTNAPLVAHAGGGLPDRTYANDLEALELAAHHGFKLIELDFVLVDGDLRLGHSLENPTSLTFDRLLRWLAENPSVTVITDAKTRNLPTLRALASRAGSLVTRFQPQIYYPSEHADVARLGMQKPILTVYRIGNGWQDEANALDVAFVTIPVERKEEAYGVRHPVFLHTVNEPLSGYGLYTDCLIPA